MEALGLHSTACRASEGLVYNIAWEVICMPIRLGCKVHLIEVQTICLGLNARRVGGEGRLEMACDVT